MPGMVVRHFQLVLREGGTKYVIYTKAEERRKTHI